MQNEKVESIKLELEKDKIEVNDLKIGRASCRERV